MFKRKCKITYITNGATVYSQSGIINDKLNFPKLNDCGEEEIEKVCEYLKARGVAYDTIYSSPNASCLQSAQIIASLFKQKPVTIDLPPRNHGEWDGMSFAELFKSNGPDLLAETPEGGETLKDFNKRVADCTKNLITQNKGNRIIIVTTPEIVQSAVAKALGIPEKKQYNLLIKTGSLTQISYFEGWSSLIYCDYKPL